MACSMLLGIGNGNGLMWARRMRVETGSGTRLYMRFEKGFWGRPRCMKGQRPLKARGRLLKMT